MVQPEPAPYPDADVEEPRLSEARSQAALLGALRMLERDVPDAISGEVEEIVTAGGAYPVPTPADVRWLRDQLRAAMGGA